MSRTAVGVVLKVSGLGVARIRRSVPGAGVMESSWKMRVVPE